MDTWFHSEGRFKMFISINYRLLKYPNCKVHEDEMQNSPCAHTSVEVVCRTVPCALSECKGTDADLTRIGRRGTARLQQLSRVHKRGFSRPDSISVRPDDHDDGQPLSHLTTQVIAHGKACALEIDTLENRSDRSLLQFFGPPCTTPWSGCRTRSASSRRWPSWSALSSRYRTWPSCASRARSSRLTTSKCTSHAIAVYPSPLSIGRVSLGPRLA